MVITYKNPAWLLLPENIRSHPNFRQLVKAMEYEDQKVVFQIKRLEDQLGGGWYVAKFGLQSLQAEIQKLKKEKTKSCLFFVDGRYQVPTGLSKIVSEILDMPIEPTKFISPDDWKCLPYNKMPHKPRWYQTEALEKLCPEDGSNTHGAVSIGTGLGKSLIITMLIKRMGLKSLVVAPTKSIARQMMKDLTNAFGSGKVGQFFDSKKKSEKQIIVAVGASLARVTLIDEHYENLRNVKVILVDESHTTPPQSLSTVVLGLLALAPYRYFFSGTQFRGDGLGLLLQGIVGDVVFDMPVRQGVAEGYLAPLRFVQYRIPVESSRYIDDPLKANVVHLRQNMNGYRHAARIINHAVTQRNKRVLVQVDTVDQYAYLLQGGLKVKSFFAHGGVTKENRDTVPQEHWKCDPQKLVEQFDNGEFPVLVGTSCIGTGTDIKSVDMIVNIVGLTSPIEISQNAGRGTRKFEGKEECVYVDYCVTGCDVTERHAAKRRDVFDSIYGKCKIIDAQGYK